MFYEKLINKLPEKLQVLCKNHADMIPYVFFGGLTTLVSIATQYLADYLGANTALATTVSWICAVTFAFFVNKIFVFKSQSKGVKDWVFQAGKFYGGRLLTYFLELGFMIVTVDILGLNMRIMKIIAQVFVLILNYFISKFIVFKKNKNTR